MKIGSLKINNGAFLAPMADFTNIAFRNLCKEYGSSLQFTELISCKSIIHKNSKTKKMLSISDKEKPVFLQLFGNNPKDFSNAIKIVEKNFDFSGYDLNAGCSVPKAIKGKYGCFLMNKPKLVGEIIHEMKQFEKPVSIKMRLGLEKENFLDVVDSSISSSVDAITLHARLGSQNYSNKSDWSKIKLLKKNVPKKIMVIGNGDICSSNDFVRMKKETNCDFVMVGRGAIGNAFLFKQIKEFCNGKKIKNISFRNEKDIFLEGKKYFELSKKFSMKPNDIRGYFINLANNFNGAKQLRNKFAMTKSIDDLEKIFQDHFKNY
ncbi:MAG: tRNA-dihydrouridine synthase family protein [Candidatus ainarchaeum sp.]|nr:tRNA-dihydrouridine synthase family protein [Candidatus ainarchaeum sp.]